jgi:cysteine-rich repeat protein
MRIDVRFFAAFAVVFGLFAAGCGGTDNQPQPNSPVCGDGTVDSGEACDDGNTVPGDGCSATCQVEVAGTCGDGKVNPGEACDDGNTKDGDGCSSKCQKEASPTCGDNHVDMGEQCDDGNTQNGDGCSSTCQKEAGPKCGDNHVDPGEACDDGNMTPGDGCEPNCTKTVANEVVCQNLPAGPCTVTAGDDTKLITGTVLTPGTIYRGGAVLIDGTGKITCSGCNCDAMGATATKISCPSGVVSPGLINTHDHITFTQDPPYNDTGERYEHRHDWRKGKNGHTKIPSAGAATGDQITWGELRFLMGGATSIVGSGGHAGLLRNLDKVNLEEGLSQTPVDFDTFPLGDTSGVELAMGCTYPGPISTPMSIMADDAYLPHVAEGINAAASNEFFCLSSHNPTNDVVIDKSAFIHSVGLSAVDYAEMAKAGTALIWSPRSNITLYGDTAIVTEAARSGVVIALGTDWMPTGSMNLLRELRCADSFNKSYLAGYFTDEDLWRMVTSSAAIVTATDDVIGTLAVGKLGDVSIFDATTHKDHRAVLDADPQDVQLVLRAGKPLYGDNAIISAIPNVAGCDKVPVCGVDKGVCLNGEVGKTYAALQTAVAGIYDAFFCGAPMNEPTCIPSRPAAVNGSTIYTGVASAMDSDGDGIPDAMDNCPTVFNPIRPMDNGVQANADGDKDGDACDVCPLDPNTNNCQQFNPNDTDGDGVVNMNDNCPTVSNGNQADADMDGKGDACDACPMVKNPGNAACPATIYDVKKGVAAVGSMVAINNVLVTGRNAKGFYVQAKPGDMGYAGSDFSGLYVFDNTNMVAVGDRVSISVGTVSLFPGPGGQIQIINPTTVIDAALNEALPPPVDVLSSDVATGGPKATALESVIVRVKAVTVTDVAPALGPGDVAPNNEFIVDAKLRVNDFLFLLSPFPSLSDNFASLTGILDFRNGDSKLELRSAQDVVAGQANLTGFSPATAFAYVGQMAAPTIPAPVTVQLSSAVATDTFIAVTSSDVTALTVVGGGVTVVAGQTSAPVLVTGLKVAPSVTLTATLNATQLTTAVQVLDPMAQPSIVSLTPGMTSALPGATVALTVNLDIPAPVGGIVVSVDVAPINAGTVPATVTIPGQQLSATFNYVDGSVVPTATVTATLAGSSAASVITLKAATGTLVINEVDYDTVGTDNDEFVELLNVSGGPLNLTGMSLVLVNGSNSTSYLTVDLSPAGMLNAGQYLVVASNTVVVAPGAAVIHFAAASNNIQNGSPDGIAVVDTVNNKLVDALSYEGSISMAAIAGLGTVSLVEGSVLPNAVADSNTVVASLCRLPDGTDTNNAATDWALSSNPTPGAANVP